MPPEDTQDVHVGAAILSKDAEDFQVDSSELMETTFAQPTETENSYLIESLSKNETEVEAMEEYEKLAVSKHL